MSGTIAEGESVMAGTAVQGERARAEIRDLVDEGLKDLQRGDLYDFDEVFYELKERYRKDDAAVVLGYP